MTLSLTFDAVDEAQPGPKWRARWERSWPAYRAWFTARGGESGPDRATCEAALARHMPELVPVHRRLSMLAGGGDLEARFLSTWCPPAYLGGCSLAARAEGEEVRLVRNYDLSPDLNEGLFLRTEWTGRGVMGMVEFLWGLSDGINDAGLAIALAYGGRGETGEGFGITTILRYVLETCETVPQALEVLERVPSHMAYNLVLADAFGATASVEMHPGGGLRRMPRAIAANHQQDARADRPAFTRTLERRAHLERLVAGRTAPGDLAARFLAPPLFQTDHANGFGTLFTAEYDPVARSAVLHWPGQPWTFAMDGFAEGQRTIDYAAGAPDTPEDALAALVSAVPEGRRAAFDAWYGAAREGTPDWAAFGALFVPGEAGETPGRQAS